MTTRRRIEVFTAGCPACEPTVDLVNRIACPSCEVEVLDMREAAVAARARAYGIQRVPSVVVDGRLADCCTGWAPSEAGLGSAGIGSPRA